MKSTSRLLLSLSLLWALLLLMLGVWWVYLIVHFEEILSKVDPPRVTKMLAWEGGTFIFLLILISGTLVGLYLKDQKRTKALHLFFSSVTHELKTPLASIKLQGEVLTEMLDQKNDPALIKLLRRLVHDTSKLEAQMDNLLQLSRLERGGNLNLTSVKLLPFVKNIAKKFSEYEGFKVEIDSKANDIAVLVDEFALELIIKNLFENTKRHSKSTNVFINVTTMKNEVHFAYSDGGTFSGDKEKLATLFYKHDSIKGSGIGLYLIRKLLEKMEGGISFETNPNLVFNLRFKKSEEAHA